MWAKWKLPEQSKGASKRIPLLFSDTGGGHRSGAQAVAEALHELYGEAARVELVEALVGYAPFPLNRSPQLWPYMVRLHGWPWGAGWHLSDGRRRVVAFSRCWWPLVAPGAARFLSEHPADVLVSFHPLPVYQLQWALAKAGCTTPLVVVVTDLVSAHAFWFAPGLSCCLVPTESARQRALVCGLPPERVVVTGQPVSRRFVAAAAEEKEAVRARLGLAPELPVVLLVGGGEGMGPMYRIARAVAESGIRAQLVVIPGRNQALRARLLAAEWPLPVRVTGFVRNMQEWMRAADLLVTKAGPSTVAEALVVGLPLVLSGAIPGQEAGNVRYVVEGGAGVWAPGPKRVAATVRELLAPDNPALAQMAGRARALARPDAARRVAEIVWQIGAR